MDEIKFGPKRDFRLPSGRWLVVAAAAGLIAAAATLIMTAGNAHRAPRPPGPSRAVAAPTPTPTGAQGTLLLTCDAANWGALGRDWRAGSLKAGPLWLVNGRQFAYVLRRGSPGGRSAILPPHTSLGAVMVVEVSDGSTVVMKATDKARPYFHFVDGFNGPLGNPLPKGDTGFTLSSCPKGETGPNGPVTDFYLGFVIKAGRAAPVDVQTSAFSDPIRLIFTSPRQGSAGSSSTS